MNTDNHTDRDRVEDNVGKLLSRAEPNLTMSEADKARILAALSSSETEAGTTFKLILRKGQAMFTKRGRPWATAAAAAVVISLIGIWSSNSRSGVAWADVVTQLGNAKTLSAMVSTEITPVSGTPTTTRAKVFFKDPGMSRTEIYAAAATSEEIESVVIIVRGLDQAVDVRLLPKQNVAQRTTHLFSGDTHDLRRGLSFDLAAESWARLRKITAGDARSIGKREVAGVAAVGFEAPISALFEDPQSAAMDGTVRVWVNAETAAPILVVVDHSDARGNTYSAKYGDIKWDSPLPDKLFDTAGLENWEVLDATRRVVGFSKTALREDVTLSIGPEDGPAILTERDIEAVLSGESTESADGDAESRAALSIVLTDVAAERIATFTSTHLGETVVVDFNGECQSRITIGGVIREEMRLDITSLGKTLEQFEDVYLTDAR